MLKVTASCYCSYIFVEFMLFLVSYKTKLPSPCRRGVGHISPLLYLPIDSATFSCLSTLSLGKLAHAIHRDFFSCKNRKFHQKMFDICLIFAQNIDCGYMLDQPRRGGSNEYPQPMFWIKNKKIRYTPANPSLSI